VNISSVIFLLFVLTSVGPMLGAVAVYHDDLISLILPRSTLGTLESLKEVVPAVIFLGYEVENPEHSLKTFFNISNPYKASITIATLHMECYCHEHDTKIGFAKAEDLPMEIGPHSSLCLCMVFCFDETGKNDVLGHRDSGNGLYLDLRNLVVVIEGVEVNYNGEVIEIGPIPLV